MTQSTCTACGKELNSDKIHECADEIGYIWCDKHCPACGDPYNISV